MLALLAGGLGLRVALACAPVRVLVRTCTADDFFYYLTIARNAAAGAGVTADGAVATNGFHPLWLALLRALFIVHWEDPETPVHVALVVLSVASVAAGWPLFAILRQTGARAAAFIALGYWLFNPRSIALALAGVEAPLAVCALSWATWLWLRAAADDEQPGPRVVAIVGALLGVTMLARTDSVLYAIVLGLDLLRVLAFGSDRSRGLAALARGVAASVAVVAPWLAWNVVRFGTLRQDSERALALRSETLAAINHDTFLGSGMRRLAAWGHDLSADLGLGAHGSVVALALAAAALVAALRSRAASPRSRAGLVRVGYALLATILPALFYCFVLRFRQAWYLTTSVWVVALLAGLAIGELGALTARQVASARVRALALALVIVAVATWLARDAERLLGAGLYPWQETVLTLTRKVHGQASPSLRFGAFNSGIVGYFSPGRVVVNLDGVVNGAAIDALAARRLGAYMREREIGVVIDTERYVRMYSVFAEPSYATSFRVLERHVEPTSGQAVLVLALPLEHPLPLPLPLEHPPVR